MESFQNENREMKVEFITRDKGTYKPKARLLHAKRVAGGHTAARD